MNYLLFKKINKNGYLIYYNINQKIYIYILNTIFYIKLFVLFNYKDKNLPFNSL